MRFAHLKVGDTVSRRFGQGGFPMQLKVTGLTEDRVICGEWEFCRVTGGEIDEFLGWGPSPQGFRTGSYLDTEPFVAG